MRKRQRWKVHQCDVCETWTVDGRMHQAGYGKHLLHKFICTNCRRDQISEQQLLGALAKWERERDHEPPETGKLL